MNVYASQGDTVDYRGVLHRDGSVLMSVSLEQLKVKGLTLPIVVDPLFRPLVMCWCPEDFLKNLPFFDQICYLSTSLLVKYVFCSLADP